MKNFVKRSCSLAIDAAKSVSKKTMAFVLLAIAGIFASGAFAEPTGPTIPDVGVDMSAWGGVLLTALGSVAAVAIGGIIAFIAIRKGIRWIRGMGAFVLVVLAGFYATNTYAEAPTIPDVGVDMSAWGGVLLTALGSVAAVAIGGIIAFIAIRKGIRWIRGMG